MRKLILTIVGVVLTTSAVSVFAAKQDRENLEQCKAEITRYYGDRTRMRLRSVSRGEGTMELRIMATPRNGANALIACAIGADGVVTLRDQEGMALLPIRGDEALSLAR